MNEYKYRPLRFYVAAFAVTWLFWLEAILFYEGLSCTLGMLFGLISPAVIAIITVFRSGSDALKKDFKRKLIGFYKLKPMNLLIAIGFFILIVACSILLSTLFGQSLSQQFAFTDDFSFTGADRKSVV